MISIRVCAQQIRLAWFAGPRREDVKNRLIEIITEIIIRYRHDYGFSFTSQYVAVNSYHTAGVSRRQVQLFTNFSNQKYQHFGTVFEITKDNAIK